MKPVFAKLALAAAALCAAGATHAGVVISSHASMTTVKTSANFGRTNPYFTLAAWNVKDSDANLLAFCIEPAVGLYTERTDYAPAAFAGFDGDKQIQRLYSQYYGKVQGNSDAAKLGALSFQLALWELYNDDLDDTFGGGRFATSVAINVDRVDPVILAAADMLATAKNESVAIDQRFVFTKYWSQGSQTVVTAARAADVPEPASLAMFGIGAGVMGLVRRRRASRA